MLSRDLLFHALLANAFENFDFKYLSTIILRLLYNIAMTFVWIHPAPGRALFIDDQLIPPCNLCGQRISTCREGDCNEVQSQQESAS